MFDEESSVKRRRNFIRALPLLPLFLFVLLFWKDVRETFGFFFRILLRLVGFPVVLLTADTSYSLIVIGFNLFVGFLLFFLIWLFLTSRQALLPVSSLGEILQTAIQLVFYIFNLHGPAVFVKDGKLKGDVKELRRFGPGVAVVDFNSAIVLERVSWAPRLLATVIDILLRAITWILGSIGFRGVHKDPVRVCGPGLIFIGSEERIQGVGDLAYESGPVEDVSGVVDLRPQFRKSEKQSNCGPELINTSVCAYTRDGIELTTNITALFSIGQDPNKAPHVLHIVCDGNQLPENLRVVSIEEKNGEIRIQGRDDKLDPEDRSEIFAFMISNPARRPYVPLALGAREPVFDKNRVFSAVYGRSRSHDVKAHILPWMDLPVRVAIDYFREILSHYNFDELYRLDATGAFVIDNLRAELRTRMRNCGLLSYRLVFNRWHDWSRVMEDKGRVFKPRELRVTPIRALKSPKVLRDRGIKMITAGFGDLVPANEVYLQRLASWRAEWERDTKTAHAVADLDAERIYYRARVRAQQELAISFQEIFKNGRYPKEALALRILQALESIAADGKTQRLLPADTISMLQRIHDWLLPEDVGMGIGNSAPTIQG